MHFDKILLNVELCDLDSLFFFVFTVSVSVVDGALQRPLPAANLVT